MNNIQQPYINRTIALAGLFQACALIKQLAWTGKCNEMDLETSIYSLLQVNPASVIEIYQDISKLSLGLKYLTSFFSHNIKNNLKSEPKDLEIIRYVFSLLYLEKKLIKKPELLNIIKTGIARAKMQANLFSITHDNVMANLAGIYLDTLSTFTFRVNIVGSVNYLTNPNIVNKTRALLLAGVRSAVLWDQMGGSRLQIFFKKNTFLNCAKNLSVLKTPQQT